MTSTNQYVRVSCLLAGALSLGGLLVGGCGGEATGLDDLNEANLETSSDDLVSSPLTPLLTCMDDLGHNNFRAHFGYKNDSSKSVRVPIGTLNFFVPLPANQGQPIDFAAFEISSRSSGPSAWIWKNITASNWVLAFR